jgi:hypothetical protein
MNLIVASFSTSIPDGTYSPLPCGDDAGKILGAHARRAQLNEEVQGVTEFFVEMN